MQTLEVMQQKKIKNLSAILPLRLKHLRHFLPMMKQLKLRRVNGNKIDTKSSFDSEASMLLT